MGELANIARGCRGSAVKDVQERLRSLGYELGDEARRAVFGPATAQAVAAFRVYADLEPGDEVDRDTWTALVDATFTFGDRLLYLRMPYFHGCDVRTLQTALSALGFSCAADGIFGGHTERAVREFQQNAGIPSDGIVGDSTFAAIERLRHAWEGKDQLNQLARPDSGAQSLGFARAAEVLERTPLCIWAIDSAACGVAERISNLAMATTAASLVVSATSPEQLPVASALLIQLLSEPASDALDGVAAQCPQVVYCGTKDDATINARMATAIGLAGGGQPRIVVLLSGSTAEGGRLLPHEEQHAAIALLDALCLAFS
jgi:peptidoglycan hydrolase-like protein with peptidoglycan-binding domain